MNDLSGITGSPEDAIAQVATDPKSLAIIASAVQRDTAAMKHVTRHAAEIVKREADDLVKILVSTSPSHHPAQIRRSTKVKKTAETSCQKKKRSSRPKSLARSS